MKKIRIKKSPTGKRSMLILTLGLVISLLFVMVSVVISTTEVARINENVINLFTEGEQITYHLGHLGRQLIRLQLSLRELITADNNHSTSINRYIAQVESELMVITEQLPLLLHAEEEADWERLAVQIEQIRSEYRQVYGLITQGRPHEAHELLDIVSIQSKDVFDALANLSLKHRNAVKTILETTTEQHEFIRTVEILTGIGLGTGILAVWLTVMRIIHRQRQRIEQFIRELEIINRDLDSFAGRVAHELKNLLFPLSLMVENLKRSLDKPERLREVTVKLESLAGRAGSIVDGLLSFSQTGQSVNKTEGTFVADEVKSVVEELGPLAEQINARVDTTNVADVKVACPPALFHIIIRNLLHNALKFMENSLRKEVQISSYYENKEWGVLVIRDTGPGMPVEALPKIFEPFYRVPGSKAAGTGIGLSTVKRLVYSCGGSISVDSKPEKGTQFTIRLPLRAKV